MLEFIIDQAYYQHMTEAFNVEDPNSIAARNLVLGWLQSADDTPPPETSTAATAQISGLHENAPFTTSMLYTTREALASVTDQDRRSAAAMLLAGFERSFVKSVFPPAVMRNVLGDVRIALQETLPPIEEAQPETATETSNVELVLLSEPESPTNKTDGNVDDLTHEPAQTKESDDESLDLVETIVGTEVASMQNIVPLPKRELDIANGSYDAQDLAAYHGIKPKEVRTIIMRLRERRAFFGHPRPITRKGADSGQLTDHYKGETLRRIDEALQQYVQDVQEFEAARQRR